MTLHIKLSTLPKKGIHDIVTYIILMFLPKRGKSWRFGLQLSVVAGWRTVILTPILRFTKTVPGKVELVAMCDEVTERADQFANRVKEVTGKKPTVFQDTDEMLAKADLDGADICTSHAHHHINAIKCLNSGVNVMLEKPVGVTVKASHAIIAAAKANGKIAANR